MTNKPELIAKHPDTGKRHRWEMSGWGSACVGEMFWDPGSREVQRWQLKIHSGISLPILRDLGPVEEEKAVDYDAFAKSICETALSMGQSIHETTLNAVRRMVSQPGAKAELAGRIKTLHRYEAQFDPDHPEQDLSWYRGQFEQQLANNRRYQERIQDLQDQLASAMASDVAKDFKIKDLESSSPAPLPVGVVRLRIYATTTNETGVFEILRERRGTRVGDLVLSAVDGKPCAYIANTELENELAFHLRRLDAPEGKLIKPVPLCDLKPGARYRDRPNGPILTRGVDAINATETPYVWPVGDAPKEGKTEALAKCPHCEDGVDPLSGRGRCLICEGTGIEKPAPTKEEPEPARLPICEDDGGGFGWFMPISEGQPSFHTPWVILPDGRAAQRTWGTERKGLVKIVPVDLPTTSIPERIPLARDPSVSYWFVREEKKRPPKRGECFLTTNTSRTARATFDLSVPLVILHRVRMGVEWLDENWNVEEARP